MNEGAILAMKQQIELQKTKIQSLEGKNQLLKDFIEDYEGESLKNKDELKFEIKELQTKLLEKESQIIQSEAQVEISRQAENRLKSEIVRFCADKQTLEHRLEDKEQTIDRLNSRLQNLERIGGALEEKGDQLNELDSKFHKERELRLVLQKELKILEKENMAMEDKLESKEAQKYQIFEELNAEKRLVAEKENIIRNLE
jgi:chromosome segregation ATPase